MPDVPRAKLEAVIERCLELSTRIHEHAGTFPTGQGLYGIVALKLFGYGLNTFKSIYYLLPHEVYEQATALFRTLWETGVNFEWIARDPENRARRFAAFTAVEERRLLTNRIRSARRAGDAGALLALTRQLGEFERILRGQLAQFSYTSGLRERWRDRFSEPSLEHVVRDIGGVWLEEYDREYLMGCTYVHGAPGAVLFPLATSTDFEAERRQGIERTALTGALAIEVMSRIYRRWLASRGMEDDDYLRHLSERTRETFKSNAKSQRPIFEP